jgi:hypothetical protein
MPPPEVWGPATWTLLHVLAEKVNDVIYPRIVGQMFDIIKRICSALPCPECAQDATIFLSKVRLHELRTKNDFKNMIYMFHNYVNAKKRKPLFNYANLEIYKRYNIVSVFNRFISVYHTKGNMKLLAESFQRQLVVKTVREWFSRNICFFIPTQQAPSGIQEPLVSEEVIGVVSEEQSNCCGSTQEPNLNESVASEAIEEPQVVALSEAIEPEVVEPEEVALSKAIEPEVALSKAIEPEVALSEAIEPEVALSEAIEPEVALSEAIEPEVVEQEVVAPEPEVVEPEEVALSEAIEPEEVAPEEVALSEAIEPEEVAPEEVALSEAIEPEEVAPEEVKSEEETELVESEAIVTEEPVSEATVSEATVSEATVSEEPVKPKRGRKKKVV